MPSEQEMNDLTVQELDIRNSDDEKFVREAIDTSQQYVKERSLQYGNRRLRFGAVERRSMNQSKLLESDGEVFEYRPDKGYVECLSFPPSRESLEVVVQSVRDDEGYVPDIITQAQIGEQMSELELKYKTSSHIGLYTYVGELV